MIEGINDSISPSLLIIEGEDEKTQTLPTSPDYDGTPIYT